MPDDETGEALVLAMPRRELFSVRGFVARPEMRVLESLADEHWFAAPSVLADDIEAKEVRVGLLVERGEDVLLSDDGVLLHAAAVPPDVTRLGQGLAALKELARFAADALLDRQVRGIELGGYLNEDGLPETRPYFILVYRTRARDDAPAPSGMAWVRRGDLGRKPLDPASALVLDAIAGR